MHKLSKTIAVLAVASVAGLAVASTIQPPLKAAESTIYFYNDGSSQVFTNDTTLKGLPARVDAGTLRAKYTIIMSKAADIFVTYRGSATSKSFCTIEISENSFDGPITFSAAKTVIDPNNKYTCSVSNNLIQVYVNN